MDGIIIHDSFDANGFCLDDTFLAKTFYATNTFRQRLLVHTVF